jgi:spectinomycin phosphotransferase
LREPPKLAETTIAAALEAHYHVAVAQLAFLPIGNDSASFVYRVEAGDGAIFFLKARAGRGFRPPSLAVPRFLHEQGVPHIAAPLPTLAGALWIGVNDFMLSLHPFIGGRTGADAGLSDEHWLAFGATVKQFHSIRLSDELRRMLPREPFIPTRRRLLDDLDAVLASPAAADPIGQKLAAFWRARRGEIRAVVGRADALGGQLRRAGGPLVLCHADMHTWNVLVATDRQFWLVDWDETILALKERDLMFVLGGLASGLVQPHETARFLEGYGDAPIDPVALAYYRYAWAVQDMAAYAEEILFLPELGEESRRAALHGFTSLFEPGSIVALARASERGAPLD